MADQLILWHRWLPARGAAGLHSHEEIAAWRRGVAARFQVAGGEVLGQLGGTVAGSFDPTESVDIVELALDLLDEAEAKGLEIALGAALGPITGHEGAHIGAAIERAQQLANRARGGELVLDARVRDEATEEFLFGRQVAGAWRGTTIDRKHPRRVDSADAIGDLHPPVFPPIGNPILDRIGAHLDADGARTFVLRGPVGAGAELIAEIARRRTQERVLPIGAAPGGVVPLASLRFALLRRFGSPEEAARWALSVGAPIAADALGAVAAGELVDLDTLSAALAEVFAPGGDRAWVVMSPLTLVDAATLAALLGAREVGADFVLIGRLPLDVALPRPLAQLEESVVELVVPPLKTSDARIVAEAVLGPDTDADVARRVAVLGGDTVIGVVEAARTLIAKGELVRGEGDGFVWRSGPRGGADMISTAALIGERLGLIDAESRQVLEALCVLPDGSSVELLEAVAGRDGIGPATFERSLDRLGREAFAQLRNGPRLMSSLMRWGVVSLIPAARSMELHRLVGEALDAAGGTHLPQLVELGYYLIEGGVEEGGRPLWTTSIAPLVSAGYRRAARHLSSWLSESSVESGESSSPRRTPLPPPIEALDEGPPSSELALDEMLGDIALDEAPPPPPRAPEPEPEDLEIDERDIVELSEEEMEEIVEEEEPAPDALVLDIDELDEAPAPTVDQRLLGADDSSTEVREAVVDPAIDETARTAVFDEPPAEPPTEEAVVDEPAEGDVTSVGPPPMPLALNVAGAIREGTAEDLERALQRATAEGGDPGAIGRVRAVAQLAAGDTATARASLETARERGRRDGPSEARHELAMALVHLRTGEVVDGIRCGLAALATSRELDDVRGEAAALCMLSSCYRALGHDAAAARIEAHPRHP